LFAENVSKVSKVSSQLKATDKRVYAWSSSD